MKASFFDMDGTLVKGFMIHEFSKHLVKKGLFEKKIFEEIDYHIKLYLENKATFREIAVIIPDLYAKGLKNAKEDIIEKEAKEFADIYIRNFIQPYTKDLVKLMKEYGLTMGISGSPIEVVSCVGRMFNFNTTYGTELEIINGIYTGKVKQSMIIKENKEAVLEKIIKENKIDLEKSFGFGDTEEDLSILSRVKYPIALNPNKALLNIVKKNRWLFFNSNDDVARKLKKFVFV